MNPRPDVSLHYIIITIRKIITSTHREIGLLIQTMHVRSNKNGLSQSTQR